MSSLSAVAGGLAREANLADGQYVEGARVDFKGQIQGRPVGGFLICAFHVFQVAQDLARAIAVKMGLDPEMASHRQGVENVLAEFLNIIIGLTCSDWAKFGLDIVFDPPEKLVAHYLAPVAKEDEAYHMTFKLSGGDRRIDFFLRFLAPVKLA
jgi:hypothetical protein